MLNELVHLMCLCLDMLDKMLMWDEDQLISQMPIEPGEHSKLSVTVLGISDFLYAKTNGSGQGTYS